jgi:quinoprotein glucose dehydrogenase
VTVLSSVCACLVALAGGFDDVRAQEWTYFGGDKAFTRYAPLDQIDRDNIDRLRVVWRRPGVDAELRSRFPDAPLRANLRSTPILIDGVLHAPNGWGLAEAFDPATGETLWVQEPWDDSREAVSSQSTRGLDYWADGTDRRLISVTGNHLYALDPATGEAIQEFGEGGRVSLVPPGATRFSWTSGAIVVNDVIVTGGTVDGAGDSGMTWRGAASEDIRGYDVRTGELLWTFHSVPRDGEIGIDTWGNDSWRYSGDLGSWCCLSADEEIDLVYVPLTAPTAAYYGGHRPGYNLFSNTLLALDARTGERVWHFQTVHHDLWEYDVVGPPTLGEITVDGRRIDAVMQPSKTGFLYTFDRLTGEPVWPIEEREVPTSSVPGERASRTQPFPTKPAPFAKQGITLDDVLDLTPELHARALAVIDSFVIGPIFTPPSLVSDEPGGKRGTLMVPGSWGSGNWNTGAFDPETGYYYAFSHLVPRVYRLERATGPEAEMDYYSPNRDAPYIDGLPLLKPPWSRITAIDMNTGEHVWTAANGDAHRDHPALAGLELPPLGVASRPAALLTRTLLLIGDGAEVFGGTHPSMWGRGFRAYDKATGDVLWETELDAGVTSAPMTYMHEGRQFIVVGIGGRAHPAEWIALALD